MQGCCEFGCSDVFVEGQSLSRMHACAYHMLCSRCRTEPIDLDFDRLVIHVQDDQGAAPSRIRDA